MVTVTVSAEYTVSQAAGMAGISASVLRVWQDRYGWPVPVRRPNGYRYYHAALVDEIVRVATLTRQGVAISDILRGGLPCHVEPTGTALQAEMHRLRRDLALCRECLAIPADRWWTTEARDQRIQALKAIDGQHANGRLPLERMPRPEPARIVYIKEDPPQPIRPTPDREELRARLEDALRQLRWATEHTIPRLERELRELRAASAKGHRMARAAVSDEGDE